MAVYRFKVMWEENPEVYRIIDVQPGQTFEEFHKVILRSVDFDSTQLASFYMSDEEWSRGYEITLLDMGDGVSDDSELLVMRKTHIKEVVSEKSPYLVYVYDFAAMWTFLIEFVGEVKEEKGKYPRVIEKEGDSPAQYDEDHKLSSDLDDDELNYVGKLKRSNHNILLDDSDVDDEIADEFRSNQYYDDEFGGTIGFDEEEY